MAKIIFFVGLILILVLVVLVLFSCIILAARADRLTNALLLREGESDGN